MGELSTPLADRKWRVLYLLTSSKSASLVSGQLDYLSNENFDVHVGVAKPAEEFDPIFDPSAEIHWVPFVREPALLKDVTAFILTIRLIRRIRPDVVNASTPKAGFLGTIAAWICRVPVRVYVVRGFRFETASRVSKILLKSIEQVTCILATHVILNSPSLLRVASSNRIVQSQKAEVICFGSGNGIDRSHFCRRRNQADAREKLGVGGGEFLIGFVGRITRDKGIEDLVAVYEAIRETSFGTRLLVVGDFESGDAVSESTTAKILVDPLIHHIGWLHDPVVVYEAVDVLLLPSYREGLPNVLLEAQACGTPIAGYASTGSVDAVSPGQLAQFVEPGDVDALSEVVLSLLSDACRREVAESEGPRWVAERFDQKSIWEALSCRYRDWLEKSTWGTLQPKLFHCKGRR